MKTALRTLLAVIVFAIAGTAFAGPQLIINTVVTDTDKNGKDTVLARFHLPTEDRQETVVRVGELEYSVTPTLGKKGAVDLLEAVTHHYTNGKTMTFGPYTRSQPRGDSLDFSAGSTTFSTQATSVPVTGRR